jgi:predicted MFS family arabinose efflux permease
MLGRYIGPYREVLQAPGVLAFSLSGVIARLPLSMFGLAIVFAVEAATDSYGQAGFVAGAALIGQAAGAPIQARFADRWGQLRMLAPVLALHAIALTVLIVVIDRGADGIVLVIIAVLAGATFPQIGALVRARWARLHARTPRLQTAYALESVFDEVVFVTGPPLVTVLATSVNPNAGLVLNLVLTVVGGAVFAAQRSTDPGPRTRSTSSADMRLPMVTLAWVVAAFAFMGGIFGSMEVVTVAFTDEAGSPGAAGLILATFAAGSLIAGVIAGSLHWKRPLRQRFTVGQAFLALAMVPLPFISPLALLAVAAFVAGFAISPTLISGFSLVEAEVPAGRLTEGLSWASTALAAGVALGAAVAGPVIDDSGASVAFWVAVASGGLAVAACVVGLAVEKKLPQKVNMPEE